MELKTIYRDHLGNEWEIYDASIEELAQQLPEDFEGHLTVRDEAGWVRGWIHSRMDWRAS